MIWRCAALDAGVVSVITCYVDLVLERLKKVKRCRG